MRSENALAQCLLRVGQLTLFGLRRMGATYERWAVGFTRPTVLVSAVLTGLVLPTEAFGKAKITYDDVTFLRTILDTLAPKQHDKLVVKQGVREMGICDWGCTPLRIWVMSDGKRIDVPLTNQMWVETLDYGLIGTRLSLNSNGLPLGLVTDIEVKPPAGSAVPVGYFLDALKQLNRLAYYAVRDRKGLIQALFRPDICCLEVYYQGLAGNVRLQEGSRVAPIHNEASAHIPALFGREFLTRHRADVLLFPAPVSEVVIADSHTCGP